MIERKPLAPNNRKLVTPKSEFIKAAENKSPTNKSNIFAYIRPGKQTAEGFGGGNRITK